MTPQKNILLIIIVCNSFPKHYFLGFSCNIKCVTVLIQCNRVRCIHFYQMHVYVYVSIKRFHKPMSRSSNKPLPAKNGLPPIKKDGFTLWERNINMVINITSTRSKLQIQLGWNSWCVDGCWKIYPFFLAAGSPSRQDHDLLVHGLTNSKSLHTEPMQKLTEVCTDVIKEPSIWPLSGEIILRSTAIKQDDARLGNMRAFLLCKCFSLKRTKLYWNANIPSL